ncbi:MAG: hypothetical protein J5737_06650 [Bacteroidales bacterium]|nr:hypothetical protein [Bacteroidales bacterium]
MKKYFAFSAALLLVAVACTQKEEEIQALDEPQDLVSEAPEVVYISANGEERTKAAIDGTSGDFTWNTGDKIAVYTSGGYKISDALSSDYNKAASATFAFSGSQAFAQDDRANFAVFPASLAYDSSDNLYTVDVTASSLKINLPGTYNLSDITGDLAPVPMVAANGPDDVLAFKTLGAMVRFTLVSVPKQTQYLTFDFNGKKVQGEFVLSGVNPGTTAVQTAPTDGVDDIITVYNDGVFSTFQKALVVNILVPAGVASTGEYTDVTVTTWDGEPGNGGHKINALTTPVNPSANWVPARMGARKREVYLPVFGITVSNGVDAGVKVVFAPGNLRATLGSKPAINKPGFATEWSFAPHQYEVVGTKMPQDVNPEDTRTTHAINTIQDPRIGDVIDLFAWVGGDATGYTGDYEDDKYKCGILYPSGSDIDLLTGSTDNYNGLLRDWGQNVISTPEGDYPAGTWRTLSKDEWYKVLVNRGGWRLRATITDGGTPIAYGYVIAPDQYTHPAGVPAFNNATTANSGYTNTACSDNVYTLEQWEKLEGAGCVFFPITNVRTKATYTQLVKPADGWYWSTLASTGKNALCFAFNEIALGASQLNSSSNTVAFGNKSFSRKCGAAVRLVRVVNDK